MEKQRFIFDIDGTLLVPDYSYEQTYFQDVLSREDALVFVPMISKLLSEYEFKHQRYDVKKLSRFLTVQSEVLITEKMIRGWKRAWSETTPNVIDGVVETLEELSRGDKDMVILTNWFLEPQITRLEKAGIRDYFTDFYGGEYALKPHANSYRIACGKYPMENCVMIGDSLEMDVYGAMNAGLDSIYYNPKDNGNFDKRKVKSIGSMKSIKEMF